MLYLVVKEELLYFLLVAAAQPAEEAAHLVLAQPRALQPVQRTLRGQHLHTNLKKGSTPAQSKHEVNSYTKYKEGVNICTKW